MEHSKSYLALKCLMKDGLLVIGISDFNEVLQQIRGRGCITLEEHQDLLLRYALKRAYALYEDVPEPVSVAPHPAHAEAV
jgi:hypothetical protein